MHVNELPYILVGSTSCPRERQFTVSLYLYLQNKTEKKGLEGSGLEEARWPRAAQITK